MAAAAPRRAGAPALVAERTVVFVWENTIVGKVPLSTSSSFRKLDSEMWELADKNPAFVEALRHAGYQLRNLDDEILNDAAMAKFWTRHDGGSNEVVVNIVTDRVVYPDCYISEYEPRHNTQHVLENIEYSPFEVLTELIDNSLQYTLERANSSPGRKQIEIAASQDGLLVSDNGKGVSRGDAKSVCEYGNTSSAWNLDKEFSVKGIDSLRIFADETEPRGRGNSDIQPFVKDLSNILEDQMKGQLSVFGCGMKLAVSRMRGWVQGKFEFQIISYPELKGHGWTIRPVKDGAQPIVDVNASFHVVSVPKAGDRISGLELRIEARIPTTMLDPSGKTLSPEYRRRLGEVYELYIDRDVSVASVVEGIRAERDNNSHTFAVGKKRFNGSAPLSLSRSVHVLVDQTPLLLGDQQGIIERLKLAKDVFRAVIELTETPRENRDAVKVEAVVLAFYYPFVSGQTGNPFSDRSVVDVYWQGRRLPDVKGSQFPLFCHSGACWGSGDQAVVKQALQHRCVHVLIFTPLEFKPTVNKKNLIDSTNAFKYLKAILGDEHPGLNDRKCPNLKTTKCKTCGPAEALQKCFGRWVRRCSALLDEEYSFDPHGQSLTTPESTIHVGKPVQLRSRSGTFPKVGILVGVSQKKTEGLVVSVRVQGHEALTNQPPEQFSLKEWVIAASTQKELETARLALERERAHHIDVTPDVTRKELVAGQEVDVSIAVINGEKSRITGLEGWTVQCSATRAGGRPQAFDVAQKRNSGLSCKLQFQQAGNYELQINAFCRDQKLAWVKQIVVGAGPASKAVFSLWPTDTLFGGEMEIHAQLEDAFSNKVSLQPQEVITATVEIALYGAGKGQTVQDVVKETLRKHGGSCLRTKLVQEAMEKCLERGMLDSNTPRGTVSSAITTLVKHQDIEETGGEDRVLRLVSSASPLHAETESARYKQQDNRQLIYSCTKQPCTVKSTPDGTVISLKVRILPNSNLMPVILIPGQAARVKVAVLLTRLPEPEPMRLPEVVIALRAGALTSLVPRKRGGSIIEVDNQTTGHPIDLSKVLNAKILGQDEWGNFRDALIKVGPRITETTLSVTKTKFRSTLIGASVAIEEETFLCQKYAYACPTKVENYDVQTFVVLNLAKNVRVLCLRLRDLRNDHLGDSQRSDPYVALMGAPIPRSAGARLVSNSRVLLGKPLPDLTGSLQDHVVVLNYLSTDSGDARGSRGDSLICVDQPSDSARGLRSYVAVFSSFGIHVKDMHSPNEHSMTVKALCDFVSDGKGNFSSQLAQELKLGRLWLSANGRLLHSKPGWSSEDNIDCLLELVGIASGSQVCFVIAPFSFALSGGLVARNEVVGRATDAILVELGRGDNDVRGYVPLLVRTCVDAIALQPGVALAHGDGFDPLPRSRHNPSEFDLWLPSSFEGPVVLKLRAVNEVDAWKEDATFESIVSSPVARSHQVKEGEVMLVLPPQRPSSIAGSTSGKLEVNAEVDHRKLACKVIVRFLAGEPSSLCIDFTTQSLVAGNDADLQVYLVDAFGVQVTSESLTAVQVSFDDGTPSKTAAVPVDSGWRFPLPRTSDEVDFLVIATTAAGRTFEQNITKSISAGPLHSIAVTPECLVLKNGEHLPASDFQCQLLDAYGNSVTGMHKLQVTAASRLSFPKEVSSRAGRATIAATGACRFDKVPTEPVIITVREPKTKVKATAQIKVAASKRGTRLQFSPAPAPGSDFLFECVAGATISASWLRLVLDDGTSRVIDETVDEIAVTVERMTGSDQRHKKESLESEALSVFNARSWHSSGEFRVTFDLKHTLFGNPSPVRAIFHVYPASPHSVKWLDVPSRVSPGQTISGKAVIVDTHGNIASASRGISMGFARGQEILVSRDTVVESQWNSSDNSILFSGKVPGIEGAPEILQIRAMLDGNPLGQPQHFTVASLDDSEAAETTLKQQQLQTIKEQRRKCKGDQEKIFLELMQMFGNNHEHVLALLQEAPGELQALIEKERQCRGVQPLSASEAEGPVTLQNAVVINILSNVVQGERKQLQMAAGHWLSLAFGTCITARIIDEPPSGSAANERFELLCDSKVRHTRKDAANSNLRANDEPLRMIDVLGRRTVQAPLENHRSQRVEEQLALLWSAIEPLARVCAIVQKTDDLSADKRRALSGDGYRWALCLDGTAFTLWDGVAAKSSFSSGTIAGSDFDERMIPLCDAVFRRDFQKQVDAFHLVSQYAEHDREMQNLRAQKDELRDALRGPSSVDPLDAAEGEGASAPRSAAKRAVAAVDGVSAKSASPRDEKRQRRHG